MLKLATLIKSTTPEIVNRALKQCRVRITRAVFDVDEEGYHKLVMATVKATSENRFTVIKFYDSDKKKLADSRVWVHCSCEYHKFVCEVANKLRGSTDIIDSNGNFPHITNPSARPHLCKHLIALAKPAIEVAAKPLKGVGDVSKQEVELMLKRLSPYIKDVSKSKTKKSSSASKSESRKGSVRTVDVVRNTIRNLKK